MDWTTIEKYPAGLKSRSSCWFFLPASTGRTQTQLIRERERERHLLSLYLSLSPPVCPLWQHLLPPLLFPIMQWACPLCCLIVLANHCPRPSCSHDAPVMTRRRWWELVSLKEWLCLYNRFNPQGETTINKIKKQKQCSNIASKRAVKRAPLLSLRLPHAPLKLWFKTKRYSTDNVREGVGNLIESCCEDINRVNRGKEEERGGEGVSERERWSSGKRSEPGPWGAATDEVAE